MVFKDYILNEQQKALAATNVVMLESNSQYARIDLLIDKSDPNVMTGRSINNIKYCIFKKKFINLTELEKQIKALYISKGYNGIGFSKLTAEDYVRYVTAKNILQKLFNNELYLTEIDPKNAAKYFLAAEHTHF